MAKEEPTAPSKQISIADMLQPQPLRQEAGPSATGSRAAAAQVQHSQLQQVAAAKLQQATADLQHVTAQTAQLQQAAAAAQLHQLAAAHLQQALLQQAAEQTLHVPPCVPSSAPPAFAHEELVMCPAMPPQISQEYVDVGCTVQNTFINVRCPPLSPSPGERRRRRSKSLPRDIGSDRVMLEPTYVPLTVTSPSREVDEGSFPDAQTAEQSFQNELQPQKLEVSWTPSTKSLLAEAKKLSSLAQRREFAPAHLSSDVRHPSLSSTAEALTAAAFFHDPVHSSSPNTPLSPQEVSFHKHVLEAALRHNLEMSCNEAAASRQAPRLAPVGLPRRGRQGTQEDIGGDDCESDGICSVTYTPYDSPCRSPVRVRRISREWENPDRLVVHLANLI